MTSRIIDCLATTDALAEIFSDRSVLQAMLDVESALARAAARAGAIPGAAAQSIAAAAEAAHFDVLAIAREARESATPAIAVVNALTERVRSTHGEAAQYVHWGATSQDVTDTATVLLLGRARPIIAQDHRRLAGTLRVLSESHAGTVMLGRTLLQPATPITFGLKVAGWYAALGRSWRRLSAAWQATRVVQFGGAAGTRAAAGARSAAVAEALANELGLAAVPPWHAQRDRLGAVVAGGALYTAALGKTARDIALLMQHEVGEVEERGGRSSTMPHKRNPSGCAIALAAAARMPGVAAAFLSAMVQEHERALGGWQAEWPIVAAAVQTTGSAVAAMATVMEELTVHPERMRSNLEATGGVVFAERAVALLERPVGRAAARALVEDLVQRSRESGTTFSDLLRSHPQVVQAIPAGVLEGFDRPEHYLGDAETLRRQLLEDDSADRPERA